MHDWLDLDWLLVVLLDLDWLLIDLFRLFVVDFRFLHVVLLRFLHVVFLDSGLLIVFLSSGLLVDFRFNELFDDRCIDVVVLTGVGRDELSDIVGRSLAEVVGGHVLVTTEHLDCGRALDAILLGQVTVGHDIDGTEPDFLVGHALVLNGLCELWVERFAVWAPVSVESDHPDVLVVATDHLIPVIRVELLDTVEHSKGLSGQDGKRCSEREFHSIFFRFKILILKLAFRIELIRFL